jgi:hypothetical protein
MSSAHESDKLARDDMVGLREWVRPVVHALAAGSAEDEAGPSTDGILNPS